MSGPASRTVAVFALAGEAPQTTTVVTATEAVDEAERPALGASEQLALYFYEDTRNLLRGTGLDLARDLGASSDYQDDPELFLRLVCADVERLLQHQFMQGLALVVSASPSVSPSAPPGEYPGTPRPVLFRAIYRVRQTVEAEGSSVRLPPVERGTHGHGTLAPLPPGATVALVVEWARDTASRRAALLPPRYQFPWAFSQPAAFAEATLAPALRYDALAPIAGDLRLLRVAGA